jgi:arginyl-tRNA synthetase
MIPGDIGAEIARLLQAGIAAGEWPVAAAALSAAGTWRPAPSDIAAEVRSYATSLPLPLARLTRRPPPAVAEALAGGLAALPWVSAARVTGDGYLTVTVTADHLAGLAPRIIAAGWAAANSDGLAGRRLTAPVRLDLSAAPTWEQAWRARRDAVTGLLARAAGAEVDFYYSEQDLTAISPRRAVSVPAPVPAASSSLVGDAVRFHGADAVGYALARTSAPRADSITRQLRLPLDLDNPFVIVRYAHADATSTLRWAVDLGLAARPEPCRAAAMASGLMQPELALLNAMSWLPERVAAAARRRRPAELAAHLEHLARAWLDCKESCPALPFLGSAAPESADTARITARLCLAGAARVTLSCGLGLLGIGAPERL